MEEEEDWDAPPKSSPKSSSTQQNNASTPYQTLKITDGYKYSYEAHSSPANIDDWLEPPSFEGARRSSNGYSQNSFRDNNRSFRNERNDNDRRFNSIRRSDVLSNNSSPRNFSTPKSNRFSNRPIPNAVQDWDAPDNSVNDMNGSWKVNTPVSENWNTPTGTPAQNRKQNHSVNNADDDDEDWDAPAGASSNKDKGPVVDIPTYKPNSSGTPKQSFEHIQSAQSSQSLQPNKITSNKDDDEDEDWDEPSGVSKNKSVPAVDIPIYKPSNVENNSAKNVEKDWKADSSEQSTSNAGNGFGKDSPFYKPNNANEEPYSNNSFNQRYENNFHSNKYSHSRSFDSNDRFSRDPFTRHSRGSHRHNPYERNSRGFRGGRGSRGGRNGRDDRDGRESRDSSYQSPYSSRDNSRNRGDRNDRSYQNSFNKNKNDRSPYQSSNNTVVEPEEDWDSPTGFVEKPVENNPPLPPPPAAAPIERQMEDDESWD